MSNNWFKQARKVGRTFRHAFRQCQLLRGDEKGPVERCQNFAVMTAYFGGQQLRVCATHKRTIQFANASQTKEKTNA